MAVEIENYKLYTIMIMMLIFGTCNTLVMKWQDEIEVGPVDPITKKAPVFTHPYFQCANMFIGEFMCLFVFLGRKYICPPKENKDGDIPTSPGTKLAAQHQLRTTINPLYLAIPASCDICGSTLMFVALTQCAASVYQMMRGIIVLITAILSILFLGKKQYCHHWSSLVTIVTGVAIVGVVGVAMSKDDTNSNNTPTSVLGVVLLLIAQLFTGFQFIAEEKILSGYYLDPLLVVGLEGFWGCCYYAILLPIFQQVKCDGALCHDGYLENTTNAL